MSTRRLGNPILVYSQATFEQMIRHLQRHDLVAVDTESDSLYRYHPQVCLIQITTYSDDGVSAAGVSSSSNTNGSSRGSAASALAPVTDYLLDPLRFDSIDELGRLFANPERETIMHAAENDIMLLQREYDFDFGAIFDTQMAARILGWRKVGLAAMLEEHFGVATNKRMQRTNWGKRPLTPEQIAYAQLDTHYLPALREILVADLCAADRWEEAQDAFQQLSEIDYRERPTNERSIWQMKEVRSVALEDMGVLDALWEWREQEAEARNVPPFKIVNNQVLVELAESKPTSEAELRAMRELGSAHINRYGRILLATVAEGIHRTPPEPPSPTPRPEHLIDEETSVRYDALRSWRSVKAKERGVTPDIILTNDLLLEIAKRQPRAIAELEAIPQIGPWKARTYGPEIFRIVA